MAEVQLKRSRKKSAISWIGRLFLKGLATLLPTILTVYIIFLAWGFVRDYAALPFNRLIGYSFAEYEWGRRILIDDYKFNEELFKKVRPEPEAEPKDEFNYEIKMKKEFDEAIKKNIVIPGILIAIIGIFFIGVFAASFIGRTLWRIIERLITKIPVFRTIYPYAKQVTEFVFGESQVDFSSVVAIEYPRKGIWQLGFVTGDGLMSLKEHTGKRMLNVFVPSAPTPVTGYVVFVPAEDVLALDITMEEVLPLIISGGVVVPEGELTPEGLDKFKERTTALQLEKLRQMVERRHPGAVTDRFSAKKQEELPPPDKKPPDQPGNPFKDSGEKPE
ncbi:MAG: DUF502 domain-containing protein [Planctomycetota bacterium]